MGDPVTQFVLFVASTIYQVDQQQKIKKEARRQAESAKDAAAIRNIRVTNSNLPIPEAFGECRVESIPVHFHLDRNFVDPSFQYGEQVFGRMQGIPIRTDSNFNLLYYSYPLNISPYENFNYMPTSEGKANSVLAIQSVIACSEIHQVITLDIDEEPYTDPRYENWSRIFINNKGNSVSPAAEPYRGASAVFAEMSYATEFFRMNREEPQYGGQPSTAYYIKGSVLRSFRFELSPSFLYYNADGTRLLNPNLIAPQDFTIVVKTGGIFARGYTVTLSWALSVDVFGYEIEMSFNGTDWMIMQSPVAALTVSLFTMHPERAYRVRGLNASGGSQWSVINLNSFTIPARVVLPTYFENGAIANSAELTIQYQQVDMYLKGVEAFIWWAPVIGANGYRISARYLNPDQGTDLFEIIQDVSNTVNTLRYPLENTDIIFKVQTIINSEVSPGITMSSSIVENIASPEELNVTFIEVEGELTADVNWSPVVDAIGYVVQASVTGTDYLTLRENLNATNLRIPYSVSDALKVWIRVAARKSNGVGLWKLWSGKKELTVTPSNDVLPAPVNIQVEFFPITDPDDGTSNAVIQWNRIIDAAFYRVDFSTNGVSWNELERGFNENTLTTPTNLTYIHYRIAGYKNNTIGEWGYWEGSTSSGVNTVIEDPVSITPPTNPTALFIRSNNNPLNLVDAVIGWRKGSGQDDFVIEYRKGASSITNTFIQPTGTYSVAYVTSEIFVVPDLTPFDSLEVRITARARRNSGNVLTSHIEIKQVALFIPFGFGRI